ncbi:MAG: DUF4097 family beta strand repeat-containing protein [Gemmatimonadota bacterium]|jgi:hypothetical protein|nr:DUF4097 family beta strand repeat-containing protein [Gemmatimonadota bacterium]
MRVPFLLPATGLLAATLFAVPASAQRREQPALDWSGRVAEGRTMVIRNLNGEIHVRAAEGDRASIVAVKSWRRGDPEQVRVEVRRAGGDDGTVIACAFWNEDASCDEAGYRGGRSRPRNDDGNDVSVSFEVRVPRGVRVVTSTVNGGLEIEGVTASVDAETVNGSITARSSGGPVQAKTVNGGLDVSMGRSPTDDLEFETVNGNITLTIPDGLDAELSMETVNGAVTSDIPVTVSGRLNPKRLKATLGKGGRRLSLETVNGSVRLRRG